MKIRVRLYHYHDLDLVSLYREGRLSVSKAAKIALNSFAQKKYFIMEAKEKKAEKVAKPVYMFNIVLNEKKDRDAIELLNKIEKGYRNNFIKQLLRLYLRYEIPDSYISSENAGYFIEREKGLSGERKVIPAPAGRNVRPKPAAVPVVPEPTVIPAPVPEKVDAGGLIIKDLSVEESKEESSAVNPGEDKENSESEQVKEEIIDADVYESEETGSRVGRAEDEGAAESAEFEESEESEAELIGMFKNMIM